jgi:osmotically-inducible protein OsmY
LKKIALALVASLSLLAAGCATIDPVEAGVQEALKKDENVAKFDFDVKNEDGKVTLGGKVKNEFQQYQAGVVAKKVTGVKSVDNKVTVAE